MNGFPFDLAQMHFNDLPNIIRNRDKLLCSCPQAAHVKIEYMAVI